MPRIILIAVCSVASALLSAPGYADLAPAVAVASSPAPLTLAQALQRARPPQGDVYLAVGADKVNLSKNAPPPDSDARVPEVADEYGYIVRDFHGVTAIAPPTMTVLNTDPGAPNPYDGMPPPDAFKLLLASLDDGQWNLLTGARGLGMSEMTTDAQHQLFTALFPGQTMTLFPWKGGLEHYSSDDDKGAPTLTRADALRGRLRLRRRIQLGLPNTKASYFSTVNAPETNVGVYQLENGGYDRQSRDTLFGVPLRAVVPNAPKRSDLDFDIDALSVPVDLTHIATVGDLATRIGYTTQLEFYADRRLEKRPVTILGPSTARARDVLQALALCVSGVYRKVGSTYILTHDLIGVGAQRLRLARFVQEAQIQRAATIAAAGDKLYLSHPIKDLSPIDDAFAGDATTTQEEPFEKLSPNQRTALAKIAADWNAAHPPAANAGEDEGQVTTAKPISVIISSNVFLDTPAAAKPIVIDAYLQSSQMLEPSPKLREAMSQKEQDEERRKAIEESKLHPQSDRPKQETPRLADLFAAWPRRAVVVRPRTTDDVDHAVADMIAIGLNELWLDAFSKGQNHLGADEMILKEALAKTQGMGIKVIARLDLLDWGSEAPRESRDLTMLGETSPEAESVEQRWSDIINRGISPEEAAKATTETDILVSPGASDVTQTLTKLIQHIASAPGVAGVALRDTTAPGYDKPFLARYHISGFTLGYTPALREDFLRRDHMDPIDMESEVYEGSVDADISLPEFDDWSIEGNAQRDWSDYRADLLHAFLTRLALTARTAAGRPIDIFAKSERSLRNADWYGLWNDLKSSIPTLTAEQAYQNAGDRQYARYAHDRWGTNLFNVKPDAPVTSWPIDAIDPGWDGFVLNKGTKLSVIG